MPKQSKGKPPAFQFYTGDWLKDPNLSLCSPATRGIFMDLLSAMHENDRSGRIIGTPHQLSRLARCTVGEMEAALTELHETGTAEVSDVTFCNGPVTVVNRRMRREWRERKSSAERVKRHRQRSGNDDSSGAVTEKSRPLSSSSSSASAITEASPPAPSAPKRELSVWQQRVESVLALWRDLPDSLRPEFSLAGKWVADWEDDTALLVVLAEIKAANAFHRGPKYVMSMLATAYANGKKTPPPLRENRGNSASARRAGYNPRDADDLESTVIRSGGARD